MKIFFNTVIKYFKIIYSQHLNILKPTSASSDKHTHIITSSSLYELVSCWCMSSYISEPLACHWESCDGKQQHGGQWHSHAKKWTSFAKFQIPPSRIVYQSFFISFL